MFTGGFRLLRERDGARSRFDTFLVAAAFLLVLLGCATLIMLQANDRQVNCRSHLCEYRRTAKVVDVFVKRVALQFASRAGLRTCILRITEQHNPSKDNEVKIYVSSAGTCAWEKSRHRCNYVMLGVILCIFVSILYSVLVYSFYEWVLT